MTLVGPLAVLADVHGNRWALEAALEDADRAGAHHFIDLGDCVAGPLDPCGTARRLMALAAVTVLGNHDRAVLEGDPSPSAAFAREQLDGVQLDWLAGLPPTAQFDGDVFACHGSPSDDTFYLLEEVVHDGVRRRDPASVRALLEHISASSCCAATPICRGCCRWQRTRSSPTLAASAVQRTTTTHRTYTSWRTAARTPATRCYAAEATRRRSSCGRWCIPGMTQRPPLALTTVRTGRSHWRPDSRCRPSRAASGELRYSNVNIKSQTDTLVRSGFPG